jgi:hypothetical protein
VNAAPYGTPVSWYDWLLFLHVLAAFLTVTAVGMLVAIALALRGEARSPVALRLAPLAGLLWTVGGVAVLVFGLWLAIYLQAYHPWDGWIIAAIVLWMVAMAAGGRIGAGLRRLRAADAAGAVDAGQTLALHAVLVLATLALLVDMIYKPGAG